MNTYPHTLYDEILKDYHYRFPKFHPIPYPQRHQNDLNKCSIKTLNSSQQNENN